MRRSAARLSLLVPLLLIARSTVAAAQPVGPTGLQFVADNASTAALAASSDPLSSTPLATATGSTAGHSVNLPAGFTISQIGGGRRSEHGAARAADCRSRRSIQRGAAQRLPVRRRDARDCSLRL